MPRSSDPSTLSSTTVPIGQMLGSVFVAWLILGGIVAFVGPVPDAEPADPPAPTCLAKVDESAQTVCYRDLRLRVEKVERIVRGGRSLLVLSIAIDNVGGDVVYTGATRFTLQDAAGICTYPSQAAESLALRQPLPTGWLKPGERRSGEIGFAVRSLEPSYALALGLGTPDAVRLNLK